MQINSINLNDRVAIVTGGAQGIGLAVGRRFLDSGARLVIWDLVAGRLDSAAKELEEAVGPGRVHTEVVDIADEPNVGAAVKNTVAKFGRIRHPGEQCGIVGPNATLADYPLDAWRSVIDVDVNGIFYCCKHVTPVMSGAGLRPHRQHRFYCRQGRQSERSCV